MRLSALTKPGDMYGRLTVTKQIESLNGRSRFECLCSCGSIHFVLGQNLRNGDVQSCGCFQKESASEVHTRHGRTGSTEHDIWRSMKQRCCNPNKRSYSRYGGRGIKVCDDWSHSFEAFYRDMGPRPSMQHSLDRIDPNGHYEPSNCRWATKVEQQNNMRSNRIVEWRGRKQSLSQWSKELGINRSTLEGRLEWGWTVDEAFTTKERKK